MFEPVTRATRDNNEDLLTETQSTTRAIEELKYSEVYVKALEMMINLGKKIDAL